VKALNQNPCIDIRDNDIRRFKIVWGVLLQAEAGVYKVGVPATLSPRDRIRSFLIRRWCFLPIRTPLPQWMVSSRVPDSTRLPQPALCNLATPGRLPGGIPRDFDVAHGS
jgi:hypothetical protein